jgi:ABC-type polysaccharide/polyol phosphate transport system ATPase subunit
MTDIAIKATHLTKTYKLYNHPIERLKESLHPFKKQYHRDFHALNDVSFEIKKGETVGIIGRNGSGKSTLLKIITGVLTPNVGSVTVNGRISAILELGAGFNPEMTGVENIYLNCAVNGLSEKEIDAKKDEIIEFSELGEFIHQPIKTYSSGMSARLAFAVAISVEPDILIVDEALSVGDARFQAKCIRKMESIANLGVNIIFVSHDIQAIKKFCKNVIWLNNGQVIQSGIPDKILEDYMSFMTYGFETQRNKIDDGSEKKQVEKLDIKLIDVSNCDSFGEKKALINGVVFINDNGQVSNYLKQGEWVKLICEFDTTVDLHDVAIGVLFKDSLNNEIVTFNSYMYDCPITEVKKNTKTRTTIKFKVPKIHPREYMVTIALSEGTQMNHVQQHWIHEATTVNILSSNNIDACIMTLYPEEIVYNYEQI